jgi:hypothetical protein
MLAQLGKISRRWDTPNTPRNQRHAFGALLVSWLIGAAAVVVAVVRRELLPLVFTGSATGMTVGRIQQRRHLSQHPAEPEGLRPYQPTDDDTNPWEHRAD